MAIKFKCDCCGLCCRHINRVPYLKEFDTGNGVCKYLDLDTNRCRIYKNRPDICNVEVGYKKFFADKYTEEEYLRMNYEACAQLKREYKESLDDKS
ncbi:MAG: hypothetical protein K6G55_06645 [Selenomonadaceae bacterium]|nr:hypothetical protein [Selenomonadaceae bacterium]